MESNKKTDNRKKKKKRQERKEKEDKAQLNVVATEADGKVKNLYNLFSGVSRTMPVSEG